jgi:hypothetical protein
MLSAGVVSKRGEFDMRDDDSINTGGDAPPTPSEPSPEPPGQAASADPSPTQTAEHPVADAPLSLWERIKHMVGR